MKHLIQLLLTLFFINPTFAQSSQRAFLSSDNTMQYTTDENNNYIVDFSYAGYKNGEEAIPKIPIVKTIQPITGDNTAHIQAAIDEVATMTLNANGIRGGVLLESGLYEIHGVIHLDAAGVVLRGVGEGDSPEANTILKAIGNSPSKRTLIVIGTEDHEDWEEEVSGTRRNIISSFLPAGSRSLQVEDLNPYEVGDQIIVFHPSTEDWLESINYGDTDSDDPWEPGQVDILYNRTIKAISTEEQKIILDVPIYDHIDNSLAQAEIYVLDEPNIIKKSGIENLRIVIETDEEEDESHAWSAVLFEGVEDCWATEVTALHFGYAAIYTEVANRVSVLNCSGLEPHSEVDGARRYNFAVNKFSNNILFQNCHTTWGRHSYVSNGKSAVSGIVFHDCESEHDITASEGHRMWSQAMLFDNITFTEPEGQQLMGLYNRGSWGDSHGWGAVNSVAWNITMEPERELILQQPPGRQNYAIGCKAMVEHDYVYDHDRGYEESTGTLVTPTSLYQTQLDARMEHGAYADSPTHLTAVLQNGSVLLEWRDIAGDEEGYLIEFSTNNGTSFQKAAELSPNTTSYEHDGDGSSGTLIYRVATQRGEIISPWSHPAEIAFNADTNEQLIPGLAIHPNPASLEVFLNSEIALASVDVIDVLGRSIEKHKNISKIDVSQWPPNIYFLRIRDEEERIGLYKLVKR
ncbi:MAG: T9SS type A sorting domain-containing protein [Saprospiraceae bacterium]